MTRARPFVECSRCGELNSPENIYCGACNATLDRRHVQWDTPEPVESTGSLIALVAAFLLVLLGVFLVAPGLGVVLAVIAAVPFIRTFVRIQRRAERGEATHPVVTVLLFLGSVGATLVTVCVVIVVALGTFCFVCIAVASR